MNYRELIENLMENLVGIVAANDITRKTLASEMVCMPECFMHLMLGNINISWFKSAFRFASANSFDFDWDN